MADFPRWSLSPRTRATFNNLLDEASGFGIDAQAVAAAGLPGLRALLALKQAAESPSDSSRDRHLGQVQETLKSLQHRKHPDLVQQFQARILALQGRGSDTEIAHVTLGEIVIPASLQTAEVIAALTTAATRAGLTLDRLRVGTAANSINPDTGAAEFDPTIPVTAPQTEIPEIVISARRDAFTPRDGDAEALARMTFAEAANQYADNPKVFEALGWSAFNRIGQRGFKNNQSLQHVVGSRDYQSVHQKFPDGRLSLWQQSANPDALAAPDRRAYDAALEAARQMLHGEIKDPTEGAQYFHSAEEHPPFFESALKDGRIEPIGQPVGAFKFFRNTRK